MLINVSDNGGKSHTMNLSLNASSPSVSLVSTALPNVSEGVSILSKSEPSFLHPSLSNLLRVE